MIEPDPKNEHPDEIDLDLELEDLQLDPVPSSGSASASDDRPVADTGEPAATGAGLGPESVSAALEDPADEVVPDSDLLLTDEAGADAVAAAASAEIPTGETGAQEGGADAEGMWVWQYGAPPPAPPFSAVFFSGGALGELYRFFACGVLVLLGSLLPWRVAGAGDAPGSLVTGVTLPAGAVCMVLALWLIWAACYGIYTRQQKILPVFLMLIPAWISWGRTLDAWGALGDAGVGDRLGGLFEQAGTGVLLAWLGSSVVAAQLALVVAKVTRKKPGAGRSKTGRSARSESKDKDKDKGKGKGKGKKAVRDRKAGRGVGKAPPDDKAAGSGDEAGAGEPKARKGRRGRRR